MDKVEALLNNITPDEHIDWLTVDLIVEKYVQRNLEEVAGCRMYIHELRKAAGTYGVVSEQSERRHLYELPAGLHQALLMKYPKVLSGDNVRTFLKRHPIFQVPEKL